MTLLTLVFAAATALSLGIVAAVLMRVGGLVVVVIGLVALFLLRWVTGADRPTLLESALLIALLEIGYLLGALTPLAERIRKGPEPRLKAEPGKDAD